MLYKVQDYHSLVHVTSEVSDTPLSQPLTAVMQSAHDISVHTPQTAIVRKWWCLYTYILLLHCTTVYLSLKLLLN